jgi:hypothetical protein
MAGTLWRAGVHQHPSSHHPLDVHYDSVVDEPLVIHSVRSRSKYRYIGRKIDDY